MALSITDMFMYSTSRLTPLNSKCEPIGSGTGFVFSLIRDEHNIYPILVTNRHVVDGAEQLMMHFNLCDPVDDTIPLYGEYVTVILQNMWDLIHLHPDPSVDLVAIPVGPIVRTLKDNKGKSVFFTRMRNDLLPRDDEWGSLSAIEDVYVVGYPDGIWDEVNNLPIIRRGSTATHPKIPYNGKNQFLIDCAIYGGSSGSPVILYNQGAILDGNGSLTPSHRCRLLGVVYGVYQHRAQGGLVVGPNASTGGPMVSTNIPNNIGAVIKSTEILRFTEVLDYDKGYDVNLLVSD